jgi:hypothetical protein
MLLYWCMTAFVNAAKEIVDQILGTYSNIFIWKFTVLALKAAPLIIGPERMYVYIYTPEILTCCSHVSLSRAVPKMLPRAAAFTGRECSRLRAAH